MRMMRVNTPAPSPFRPLIHTSFKETGKGGWEHVMNPESYCNRLDFSGSYARL